MQDLNETISQKWLNFWKDNKIGFHQNKFHSFLTEFILNNPLPPNSNIFVPLCGKSLDMIYLLEQNYKVIGIELSPIAVHDFFRENNIKFKITKEAGFEVYSSLDGIQIYCGDFFHLSSSMLGRIDLIYDRAALIALPQNLRFNYVACLKNIDWSQMLLISLLYPVEEMTGPPFSIVNSEIEQLFKNYKIEILKSLPSPDDCQFFGLSSCFENSYLITKEIKKDR